MLQLLLTFQEAFLTEDVDVVERQVIKGTEFSSLPNVKNIVHGLMQEGEALALPRKPPRDTCSALLDRRDAEGAVAAHEAVVGAELRRRGAAAAERETAPIFLIALALWSWKRYLSHARRRRSNDIDPVNNAKEISVAVTVNDLPLLRILSDPHQGSGLISGISMIGIEGKA
jgi:hypothetical protein